jgi:outer membrane biosynthesis protein TonB
MRQDSLLNSDNAADQFLAKPRRERAIQITVSRNTLVAVLASLLLHAILLFWVIPKPEMNPIPQSTTIEVNLAPLPQTAPVIAEPTPLPEQQPEPPTPKVIAKKPLAKPSKPKPQDFSVPEVLTSPAPSPLPMPPPSPTKPPAPNEAPVDMMAMVNQRRSQRQAMESYAAQQNAEAAARERGPSEDEKRDRRIMENLKVGTNGIFEVKTLSTATNTASFSFKGWTDNYNNAKMQFFQVEARSGQDIRLVMIRRMIDLIREHYQGDFEWESHRLGRSVMKSARIEDSAELEDFLMQEFFGPHYKTQ